MLRLPPSSQTRCVWAQNAKSGAGENRFGVRPGDIRVRAKRIRMDRALALSLWDTGSVDARFLATLRIEPKLLSTEAMVSRPVRTNTAG